MSRAATSVTPPRRPARAWQRLAPDPREQKQLIRCFAIVLSYVLICAVVRTWAPCPPACPHVVWVRIGPGEPAWGDLRLAPDGDPVEGWAIDSVPGVSTAKAQVIDVSETTTFAGVLHGLFGRRRPSSHRDLVTFSRTDVWTLDAARWAKFENTSVTWGIGPDGVRVVRSDDE